MDIDWKAEKVRSLDNEVKDLHPLLNALFLKLPDVKSVIYTQGNRENGADFVLVKNDTLLDQDDYIGVVVKSGSIKQNSDDVHRQIKECMLVSRPIENGKKFVYLTEIWVITNKDITRNAEDFLHAEYKSAKVRFIDGVMLVKLIDKYFQDYWRFSSLSVNKFVERQKRLLQSSSELHRLLPASFGRVGIDFDVVTNPPDAKRKFGLRKTRPAKLWTELKSRKFIFLEGGMGSGKSDLLRSIALRLCEEVSTGSGQVVPYCLNYRELIRLLVDSPGSFLDKIVSDINDESKSLIVIIDGLDESLEENSVKVSRICGLAAEVNNRAGISLLVASRVVEEESPAAEIARYFDKYKVRPLTFGAIIKFVEKICQDTDVSTKLRDDLQRSPLMRALPRTPLSAILLGKLLKENINELPATLPELYSKYVELVLGRWDLQKNGGSEKEYETLQRLTSLVATYFLDHDLDVMGLGELRAMFKRYLEERRTGQALEPMLDMFIRKSELISFDDEKEVIAFRHKSFSEFFYAQAVLMEKGKNADIKMPFSANWTGIEYFYLGLVRDAPDRLSKLSKFVPLGADEEFIKLSQFGMFLMAAYQTPYEVIKESLYNQFVEASRNYNEIVSGVRKDFFNRLPELQILSVFTQVLRRGYSYEFFRPALQDARIQAEIDSGLSDDDKVVCIFFVDAILSELEDASAFESLIDRHEANLNWTIRLGIAYAAADVEFVNSATKAIGRKIEKSVKGNLNLREYFKTLEATPLNDRKDISK